MVSVTMTTVVESTTVVALRGRLALPGTSEPKGSETPVPSGKVEFAGVGTSVTIGIVTLNSPVME
jgi:hypothetical protein